MSCQHEITITNFKCGQTVSYPLLIIKGAVENHDSDSCNCEEIHVKKSTTSSFKVVSGEFKAFLEVEQGQNEIIFFFCGTKLKITLNYQPRDTKFTVLPLYIICEGHDGEFQAPPTEESTVTSAIRRITVASKLIQSAIADILHESGKERKTFQLERDCVVFQSRLHYLVARKMSQEELWETLAKEISTSNWDVANTKFLGFLSCTWYCGANPAVDLTHEDIIKRTQAHVALGGGGLGLFGTACLYTWPENLEQVLERFENTTSVDKDKFMDQSGCRGTLGACFSTTLGAALHELCHTLDLGHTREGIMARGFEDVDKIFTVNEKREKNPRLKRLVERRKEFYVNGKDGGHGAFFTRSSLMILAYHRWLNNFEPSNKTIKYDASTKLVSSRAGLRVIELRQEEDSMISFIIGPQTFELSVQSPLRHLSVSLEMNGLNSLVSVEFEVFGKVQGLYFTKYCKEMCEELGISGWVKNTKRGSIQGKLQGLRGNVEQMCIWLSNTGSPGSQIEHCDLQNWQTLAKPDFRGFTIRF